MKITRWVLVLLAAAAMAVSATRASAAEAIVFVDLDRAFNEFYKTKMADAQLKEQADGFNVERKTLVDEYEKLQEKFNALRDSAQDTALSEESRAAKRSEAEDSLVELRAYETKIRRYDESHRKQLDDQSRRMRKRIVDEILQVVEEYAQTQGYTAVLDSSGQSLNGVNSVVYYDVKLDITDSILGTLNKGKQDELAPEIEKPAASTTPAAEEKEEEEAP